MTALLMALAYFVAWSLIGLGVLAALRVDLGSLRVALTAPAVGTSTMILPLFVLSHAGVPIGDCALPVIVILLGGSAAVVALRRPQLPFGVVPVFAICVAGLLLAGWPMFDLGFRWISNANDDMANYVLSATQLLHHGLLTQLDVVGLSNDRNYASATQALHGIGSRPGADILLAALTHITGRHAYEVFMPMILALNLCTICGAAALAMQASRRWWAGPLGALLLVVSPLGTFGVLQQLLPQVWGLGLATALFALLMRQELHRGPGASVGELVVIGILTTTILVVYVELASILLAAYALYVVVLALRREVAMRTIARLWIPPIAIAAVVLNTYLIRELEYVSSQATTGLASTAGTSLFGFTLVPSALPGVIGLLTLPPSPTGELSGFIVLSIALLTAVLVACLLTAFRGTAASVVLVAYSVLGVLLWTRSSDFGLYKVYMYSQPFLAAAGAVLFSRIARKSALALFAGPLLLLIVLQLSTQRAYVNDSRDPVDLPHASDEDLLPAFRRFFADSNLPVISVTENPTLGKLQAVSAGRQPLYFISKDLFANLLLAYSEHQTLTFQRRVQNVQRLDGWRHRTFNLHTNHEQRLNVFGDNTHASAILTSGRCVIVFPTGSQTVLNRRSLPEGSPDLIMRPCRNIRNLLVFTSSRLGQAFYLPGQRAAVSLYQLESDSFDSSRTMSGLGRYVLFRILGPTNEVRLAIDFTKTLRHDGSNFLPPAAVVGATRGRLALVGRGSARVFSKPLRPQIIGGQPYLLLDMGQDGEVPRAHRRGIPGLYSRSVVIDPRYLTSYVRDISLIGEAAYRRLRAPFVVKSFPADLANPDLEYSGIYEDGWVAEHSYIMLAGGNRRDLLVLAEVLSHPGQRLQVLVDGRAMATSKVAGGTLRLRVPLPAAPSRRRIELRWAGATPLAAPDLRPAAALLKFIGLVPPRQR